MKTVHADDRGTLVQSDNLPFMRTLDDGCCDLIYVDPPFWTQRQRTSARSARGFDDTWPEDIGEYVTFLSERLAEMRRLLSDRGVLCVHLDWRVA